MNAIRYQRRPEVLMLTGISNSTLHNRINHGLMVPPISLGARAVGWLEHEVNLVLAARAGGMTDPQVKELVKALVDARGRLAVTGGAQ